MGIFAALLPALTQLLDKLIPDPQAKAAAQIELARLAQSGELAHLEAWKAISLAQAATNTAEAAAGPFRGGWRPYIGWTCGAGLSYSWIVRPLLPWLLTVAGVENVPDLPALDTAELLSLVLGMLGLAGLRTMEKGKGAA
jgi:hypothetical protein